MGIGTSLFLIAVGAILYFAVDATISGLEITTVGLILMIVGVVGLVISLFMLSRAPATDRRRGSAAVVREREPTRAPRGGGRRSRRRAHLRRSSAGRSAARVPAGVEAQAGDRP